MADIFSSHPYPGRKNILPLKHTCEVCERVIATKDRAAHERSKKHRQIVAEIEAKIADETKNAQGATESAKTDDGCRNCGQAGHFARDCTEPRKTGACFNCGEVGHNKADCPNEPAQRKLTCRNCNREGHMARECTEPRNPATVTCNNCSQVGHFARDCPEPKDWSKVVCNNCGHTGHTAKRCTAEPAPVAENNYDFTTAPSGGEDWMNNTNAAIATDGDWTNGSSDANGNAAEADWATAATETANAAGCGW